ncbi:DSBA-like thioredoxin domain-containing protein [Murinocardiopsis flavida]|uniref:DSBA-like thioredoxin domain-containing protein n=1 Tax=Murinocardiopsis flavida TaxID=645275 RepID=A0A2P8DSS1_9ACTN|nr:DSBA-like thioredoxin domain-containing protein [Murinocardiopsis flavida]
MPGWRAGVKARPHLGQALEAGLGAGEVRAVLDGDAYGATVRSGERDAAGLGVTGVPSLVIGGGPPLSAVQPPEALTRLLKRAVRAEGAVGGA